MRISDWSSDVCSSDLDDREKLTGDSRVILIVEDDAAFARILCDLAHETGFQCLIAETADEGVLMARQYLPHAVILDRSEEHTSELQSLMRISYAVFCLKKKNRET